MRKLGVVLAAAIAVAVVSNTQDGVTQAQSDPLAPVNLKATPQMAAATEAYWTAERFASAKPMPLPTPTQEAIGAAAATAGTTYGVPQSSPGREPESGSTSAVQLFDPALFPAPTYTEDKGGIQPDNVGTYGAHFTSSRLIPLSADRQYPYKTVGKLFFTIPGSGDYVCSASVISYRILVTAGHCVHSGNGSTTGWYTNWVFVPAYRNGLAPYQSWNWNQIWVTGTWFSGGGGVPNAADYAMIAVSDRYFGTKLTKIGRKLGFLGWQTLSLVPNHATMLGYPCNLDACMKMHQETAGSYGYDVWGVGTGVYGSDARGGSSGGPWVQNFGALATGQTGGLNPGLNRVIAVTSWAYVSTDPKVQGASVPDQRWVTLWNNICAPAGNCTP